MTWMQILESWLRQGVNVIPKIADNDWDGESSYFTEMVG
jgi:hypothetical protein